MCYYLPRIVRIFRSVLMLGLFTSQLKADSVSEQAGAKIPLNGRFNRKLIQGRDGNFYGTSSPYHGPFGGTYSPGNKEYRSFFKMTPSGKITVLVNFTEGPIEDLIQGKDGNFYTTATATQNGTTIYSKILKITPSGEVITLSKFKNKIFSSIIQGNDDNFYGIYSNLGPINSGIFRMTPSGKITDIVVANYDNERSLQTLVQSRDGNLYGLDYTNYSIISDVRIFKVTLANSFPKIEYLQDKESLPASLPGNLFLAMTVTYVVV